MGKLSEHFNTDYFACHCGRCNKEVKMSLTLVGILEGLNDKIRSRVFVKKGYVCDNEAAKETNVKRNYYSIGKAVDIFVSEDKLTESFAYLEEQPEVMGLGYDAGSQLIKIDFREKERYLYVVEGESERELNDNLRDKYKLGKAVVQKIIPEPKTVEVDA